MGSIQIPVPRKLKLVLLVVSAIVIAIGAYIVGGRIVNDKPLDEFQTPSEVMEKLHKPTSPSSDQR